MKKFAAILVAAFFLVMFQPTSKAMAEQENFNACGALAQNHDLVLLSNTRAFKECRPWESCWKEFQILLENRLTQTPEDWWLALKLGRMKSRMGPEIYDSFIRATREKADSTPTPQNLFLASQFANDPTVSLRFLAQAQTMAESFPIIYLALARNLLDPELSPKFQEKFGTAEYNLAQFLNFCTENTEALTLARLGDANIWTSKLASFRTAIFQNQDWESLSKLWQLEDRLKLPRKIQADLELLDVLQQGQNYSYYALLARKAGLEMLEKPFHQERQKIITDFPCSDSAVMSSEEIYWEHQEGGEKNIEDLSSPEAQKLRKALVSWIEQCPNVGGLAFNLAYVDQRIPELSDKTLQADFDFTWRAYAHRRRTLNQFPTKSPGFIFPEIFLKRGAKLSAVDRIRLQIVLEDMDRWGESLSFRELIGGFSPQFREAGMKERNTARKNLESMLAGSNSTTKSDDTVWSLLSNPFSLPTEEQEEITQEGKKVDLPLNTPFMIYIWETHCGPCHTEIPLILEAAKKTKLPIFFLNVDTDPSQVLLHMKKQGWEFDPNWGEPYFRKLIAISQGQLAWGYPLSLVVDHSRKVVAARIGYSAQDKKKWVENTVQFLDLYASVP